MYIDKSLHETVRSVPSNLEHRHHIVVAGGCHVYGWPIGDSFSFTQVGLSGAPHATFSIVAPLNLRNYRVLIEHLGRRPADVLILQLGNYETLGSIPKHFRAIFRRGRRRSPSASSSETMSGDVGPTLTPETVFRPSAIWRMRILAKHFYRLAAIGVNLPLFDAEEFRLGCWEFLTAVSESADGPRHIIFLSPLPCADHLICRNRSDAAEIARNICREATSDIRPRLHFLDSSDALGIGNRSAQLLAAGIFADDLHLNGRGHHLLGGAVASLLRQIFEGEKSEETFDSKKGSGVVSGAFELD